MINLPATVDNLEGLALPRRPLHLAIGMFDGLHLGHQAVVEAAIHGARRSSGISGVLTFDPHPSHLFRPDSPTRLLMPRAVKQAMLREMGVGLTIVHPFSREFAAIEAADFPGYVKTHLPSLAAIYVGENFRFGKRRIGDVPVLIAASKPLGLTVYSAERIKENGDPISSTRIREELVAGRIERVNALLGHTYRSVGAVQPGRQLGRTIGFPTVNLPWEPELPPRLGVYAVRARHLGGPRWMPAVANFGQRPTVENGTVKPLLEIHFLSHYDARPGDTIEALWEHFIRPEQKFDGLDVLKAQITQDRETAKKYFHFQ